jgi:xanthine dehydrogenase FAD-binding subunit
MVRSEIANSLKEALQLLNQDEFKICAGGTDLLVQNRNHTSLPIAFKGNVIYVSGIEELNYIKTDSKNVYIGAVTSLEMIMKHKDTPKLLKETLLEMASPAIRNTATLAGNIGNASPAGDSLVTLYLLDAKLKIQSLKNEKIVKLQDFILGPRKIALEKNEMITEIIIPKVSFTKAYFKKVGTRLSDALSKLSFACAVRVKADIIEDIRITFGAVYMTVIRNQENEKQMIGKTVSEVKANLEEILGLYNPLIKPINDQRSNISYRKTVANNLLRDFIEQL